MYRSLEGSNIMYSITFNQAVCVAWHPKRFDSRKSSAPLGKWRCDVRNDVCRRYFISLTKESTSIDKKLIESSNL